MLQAALCTHPNCPTGINKNFLNLNLVINIQFVKLVTGTEGEAEVVSSEPLKEKLLRLVLINHRLVDALQETMSHKHFVLLFCGTTCQISVQSLSLFFIYFLSPGASSTFLPQTLGCCLCPLSSEEAVSHPALFLVRMTHTLSKYHRHYLGHPAHELRTCLSLGCCG